MYNYKVNWSPTDNPCPFQVKAPTIQWLSQTHQYFNPESTLTLFFKPHQSSYDNSNNINKINSNNSTHKTNPNNLKINTTKNYPTTT